MPIAIANLFDQELQEARATAGVPLFDPSIAACTVLILFANWYGCARRIPQTAAVAEDQIQHATRLHQSLERFYPKKYMGNTKKYHNMLDHVHTVGFAVGGWEIISANTFEVANKVQKGVVLHHTNRKNVARQVLQYQIRSTVSQRFDWTWKVHNPLEYIPSLEEQEAEARGAPAGLQDYAGVHFPMIDLLRRMPRPQRFRLELATM